MGILSKFAPFVKILSFTKMLNSSITASSDIVSIFNFIKLMSFRFSLAWKRLVSVHGKCPISLKHTAFVR